MKIILWILFSLFAIECSKKEPQPVEHIKIINPNDSILGRKLIENDYLKYADSSKTDFLKKEITDSFMIYDEETYRFAHIDAEELAEFSFDFFLPQLSKMLARRNIPISIKTADDYETTHNIFINNEKINLYTQKELQYKTYWKSAPKNFFGKLNDILKARNVDEKFYLVNGGNDLDVLLLTENQYNIIKERYRNESENMPYLP